VGRAQLTFTTNNGSITITGYTGNPTDLNIPSTTNGLPVTSIGAAAFINCNSLTSITIPDSVTNIGVDAFAGCSSLANLNLGNGVSSIDEEAFYVCTSLTYVRIPNSLNNIGIDAFEDCSSLTAITVAPNNLAYASLDGVLFDVSLANLILFPPGLGGSYAIPNSVTNIDTFAFEECSLASVTIPASLTSIGSEAFFNCIFLTNITVAPNNPAYSSLGGVLFDASQANLILFPLGLGGSYAIPNGVTNLGAFAFSGCIHLTSMTIPNSVATIGGQAFFGCSGLTNVTISDSVTSIGISAFEGCTSLTNVSIPNSVTTIGSEAFEDCYGLTSLNLGSGVSSIGAEAFYECSSLTSVAIPNSVTNISNQVFAGCSGLTNLNLGSSQTSIGIAAFDQCTNLKAITVAPNNLAYSSLGGVLFDVNQANLILFPPGLGGSYAIPNGVTTIDVNAFYDCSSLASVTIPNSLTNIGAQAFYGCTGLLEIYFQGNSPNPTNDSSVFSGDPATVYYLPGTTGWGSVFDGLPTVSWNPQVRNGASFDVQTNQFGFNIAGSSNLVIVVEACTNLANPVWQVVSTNVLTGGLSYFSDPQWTNYSGRFYRFVSP
jgi:hypothetical protein